LTRTGQRRESGCRYGRLLVRSRPSTGSCSAAHGRLKSCQS
jgi:hypothetical protein